MNRFLYWDSSDDYSFSINLDNNEDELLAGTISNDTIRILVGFPYADANNGCESYSSFFSRQ
ncbi:hypothetical protein JYT74_03780 [Crocinitomix catalasitica]|nr:hypothetical protein [Crocinitomix catalasitica]